MPNAKCQMPNQIKSNQIKTPHIKVSNYFTFSLSKRQPLNFAVMIYYQELPRNTKIYQELL